MYGTQLAPAHVAKQMAVQFLTPLGVFLNYLFQELSLLFLKQLSILRRFCYLIIKTNFLFPDSHP